MAIESIGLDGEWFSTMYNDSGESVYISYFPDIDAVSVVVERGSVAGEKLHELILTLQRLERYREGRL